MVKVGVLFADIRGFTTLSETMTPAEVRAMLETFYSLATEVLIERYAIIDKLVGDEVMALFLPDFPKLRDSTCDVMVEAASELQKMLVRANIGVGIGLHYGTASVGNVGTGEVKDFTAVGDTVNTAARLQGIAPAGHVVFADAVHKRLSAIPAAAAAREVTVKGRTEAVKIWEFEPCAPAAVA